MTVTPFPLWTYLLPIWSLVMMVLIGLIYALTGENGELQKRLLKDIEKLRSQTGESIESVRKIQKMFLNTIHGKIQGKITASTLLIENKLKDIDSEIIPPAIKDELSSELGKISEDAVKDLEMLALCSHLLFSRNCCEYSSIVTPMSTNCNQFFFKFSKNFEIG